MRNRHSEIRFAGTFWERKLDLDDMPLRGLFTAPRHGSQVRRGPASPSGWNGRGLRRWRLYQRLEETRETLPLDASRVRAAVRHAIYEIGLEQVSIPDVPAAGNTVVDQIGEATAEDHVPLDRAARAADGD